MAVGYANGMRSFPPSALPAAYRVQRNRLAQARAQKSPGLEDLGFSHGSNQSVRLLTLHNCLMQTLPRTSHILPSQGQRAINQLLADAFFRTNLEFTTRNPT